MDKSPVKRRLRAALTLALSALAGCGGGEPPGPGGSAGGSTSGGAGSAVERDGALVAFPLGGAPAKADAARRAAADSARQESRTPSPVVLEAGAVPGAGGETVFFQQGGDYRQVVRLVPGVEHGLTWRLGPDDSLPLPAGSKVTLDVVGVPSDTAEGGADQEAGELGGPGTGRTWNLEYQVGDGRGSLAVGTDWESVDLPMPLGATLASVRLAVPAGSEGHILLGSARVRSTLGERPPTVLFVSFDTSRADHFSAINPQSPSRTPHFDRVAAQGVLYTNAYSSTNVTNPSHISLMTGVSPRDTKIVDNHTPLHHSAVTLAEHFESAGYQTYAVLSAFHLGHELSGLGQGFHRLDTTPDFARSGEETLAVAESWLPDAEGSPLFLWFHLFDPHAPYRIPDSRLRKLLEGRPDPYAGDERIEGPRRVTPKWARKDGFKDPAFLTALYGGGVEHLDSLFGRLLEHDRFDGATIAVTADHGEGLGERDVWWDHSGTFYPMLHVPLAIRHSSLKPGTIITAPVENRGLAKLLLGVVELPAPGFAGTELPLQADAEGDTEGGARFAMAAHGGSAAIAQGDWILEMFLKERDVDSSGRIHDYGSVYLYNAVTDPGCRRNLVAVEYERAKEMRARLIEWVQSAEVTGMNPVNHDVDPKVLEKLAQMGYSGGLEEVVEWWAPALVDEKGEPTPWAKSPWNLGFQSSAGQELLAGAVERDETP